MSPTWPTGSVRTFDVYIEHEAGSWSATSPQMPQWVAVADRPRGARGICELAWEGLNFCIDDPAVSIVVQYHWPQSGGTT